jgi:hypothetical protein
MSGNDPAMIIAAASAAVSSVRKVKTTESGNMKPPPGSDHGAICGGEAISEWRARRRGWITTSTSAAELSVTVDNVREIRFRWRNEDDDKRDAEAAEAERLREEGKHVVSIGWGGAPDHGKTIEHEANSGPPNKD